ncbi:hypothetical protein ENSA5_40280 [Enhygromyxa salina]|uniref:Gram-negative bacterial tonB protein n=1 Tax=Enhygromyxa salina TaxID=215803 RepID=A0A2S9XQL1_9BACT|nr:AgmX/PglI C-terminal domain-containing protein [Enhygromyxa salina]PRP95030.1 hypothetical protein ENSA5_40280 [Enhygromyxa salina]
MPRLSIFAGLLLATSTVSLLACEAAPSAGPREQPGQDQGATPPPRTPSEPPLPTKPEVKGPVDEAVVLDYVSEHTHEIQGCYEAALPRKPELEGTVTIRFSIDSAGKVTSAEAPDGDAFGGPRAVACMLRGVKRWKFPSQSFGGPVEVTYPFALTSDQVMPAETVPEDSTT